MAQDLTREEFVRGTVAVVGATVASSVVLAEKMVVGRSHPLPAAMNCYLCKEKP